MAVPPPSSIVSAEAVVPVSVASCSWMASIASARWVIASSKEVARLRRASCSVLVQTTEVEATMLAAIVTISGLVGKSVTRVSMVMETVDTSVQLESAVPVVSDLLTLLLPARVETAD